MQKSVSAMLVLVISLMGSVPTAMAGAEPYLGEITLFGGLYAPKGYAYCDGRVLSIYDNQALYAVIGNQYGGDGRQNFALPNLQQAETALGGVRYIMAIDGLFPPRN